MESSFDHVAFHEWSIAWTRARLDSLAPFRFGLTVLDRRAVAVFRRQGKTRRVSVLERLGKVLAPPPDGRRRRWAQSLTARAERDTFSVFPDLPRPLPRPSTIDRDRGLAALWEAVWLDIHSLKLDRSFPDRLRSTVAPDPVLIDLLVALIARGIPPTPSGAAEGCRVAGLVANLLLATNYPDAGVVATMLSVLFNPKQPQAHVLLALALAETGLAGPDAGEWQRRALAVARELENRPHLPACEPTPSTT